MARKKKPEIVGSNELTSSRSLEGDNRHHRILQQLQKILSSPEFYATKQQKSFLAFVVEESLAGRSDQLKGYTVATQVFGRAQDFDSQLDPIVSVQANKLRRALEHYYLVDGLNDSILIDIPKGTYVPVFIERGTVEPNGEETEASFDAHIIDQWPTLLIVPFNNRTGDAEKNHLCIGIPTELAAEISYFQNMKVVYPREGRKDIDEDPPFPDARFKLSGDVYQIDNGIKVMVSLEDRKSGRHIWGDTYSGAFDVIGLAEYQENIVRIVASKVSGDFGIVSRLISAETRHVRTTQLSTYEAILRFYEHEQSLSPGSFKRSMEALTGAIKTDPDCGRLWTLLGQHYGTIYNLDIPGFENPLQKAVEYTERGAMLEPHCQRAIGTLALIRFYSNELTIAIDEVNRALSLNPNSLFILDGLAYILMLSGDWKRGVKMAQKVIKMNPYLRVVLHDALWVNYLREEKYNHAYHEAMHGRRAWLFWDPLEKASTLGLLGQEKEGQEYAEKLLTLRPDFPLEGRKLIRNYIKFEDIAERIERGLQRVGIELS